MTEDNQAPGITPNDLGYALDQTLEVSEEIQSDNPAIEEFMLETNDLYSMSRHKGWSILKKRIQKIIEELKDLPDQIPLKEIASVETYGAKNLAARFAREHLEMVIAEVEMAERVINRQKQKEVDQED